MMNEPGRWTKWGRALWVLFALNSIYVFSLTLWMMLHVLQAPSARLTEGLAADSLGLGFYKAFFIVTISLMFLTYFSVALLIVVRRPTDSFALFTAIFLVNFGAANAYPEFTEFMQFYLSPPLWYAIPIQISNMASWTLLIPFLVLFPDGQFVPRWSRVIAAIGIVLTTTWSWFPQAFYDSNSLPGIIGAVTAVVVVAASLYIQSWRYRHHFTLVERQQAKWFVFALAIFLGSTFLYFFSSLQLTPLQTPAKSIWSDLIAMLGTLGSIFIPIAVGIAILRYRLWDIDLIIRRTLAYGALTLTLALVYFASVLLLQNLFQSFTGQEQSPLVIVVSTLLIAALFNPLRRRIQRDIDRRFFRSRYDTEQTLDAFAVSLRQEVDLDQISRSLLSAAAESMQPEHASLWLRPGKGRSL